MTLMTYIPQPPTALGAAEALNTQVGNYFRAVRNGAPHNLMEARAILATARQLLEAVEASQGPTVRTGAQGR